LQLQQWPSLWQQLLTWLLHRPEGAEPHPLPLSQAAARVLQARPAPPAGLQAPRLRLPALLPSSQPLPLPRARAVRTRPLPARLELQAPAPTGTVPPHQVLPAPPAGLQALRLPPSSHPHLLLHVRTRPLPVRPVLPHPVLLQAPAGPAPRLCQGQMAALLRAAAAPATAAPLLLQETLSQHQVHRTQLRLREQTLPQ